MQALKVTDKAAEKLKGLMAKQPGKAGLKVGTKTAGCSGLMYDLAYVEAPETGDEIVDVDGVKLFVDSSSLMYLLGTEMDWQEDKFQTGFVFNNPNAKDLCGCGESFKV